MPYVTHNYCFIEQFMSYKMFTPKLCIKHL